MLYNSLMCLQVDKYVRSKIQRLKMETDTIPKIYVPFCPMLENKNMQVRLK